MMTAFGWVLFAMAIWGLVIFMEALQRRFAPELGEQLSGHGTGRRHRPPATPPPEARDRELAELKRRIETLEAIVTDRRYQWEESLRRDERV